MDTRERKFWIGVARAFGGAVFFSLPLLMTMEMWWLGFYMSRPRLVVFMVAMLPVLVGLSRYSGFEETTTLIDSALDAVVAYGIGFVAATLILTLLGIINPSMSWHEVIGKVALQAVPASYGAILARSQFGGQDQSDDRHRREPGYAGELLLMAAGAVFLAFNVAPTAEIPKIAYRTSHWLALALVGASLVMMHGFVYSVGFQGSAKRPPGVSLLSLFARYTVPGYVIALLVSLYVLWTFGRYEGQPLTLVLAQGVVLAFPASLGAAAARLIL